MYTQDERDILHRIARESILSGLQQHRPLSVNIADYPESLQQQHASFVTLTIAGELRGCIGSLSPYRALVDDIAHNAYAAAFTDPRFVPLSESEFDQLEYHISVLSDTSPMSFASEADLLSQIRPNIDGLVLEDQGRKGTFLPSVWEQLPEAQDFLRHLKLKAGLSPQHWSDTVKVSRYTVEGF